MKKLFMLATAALLVTGAFAGDGKKKCAKGKSCCKTEATAKGKCSKDKKECKDEKKAAAATKKAA